MLINCIAVFHHSRLPPALPPSPIPRTTQPGGLLTSKWSCKGILIGHGHSVAWRWMLEPDLQHACFCTDTNTLGSSGLCYPAWSHLELWVYWCSECGPCSDSSGPGEMCLMSDFAPDRLQWGRRGGGGCGGGGGVGVLHCSWSEAKTKSAILWWFCLSSVVFMQWLSTFLGVMEYLITPLKAFCPSTCSKICTHALQTVETQSCVLADTLVFSHFSQRHQNCTRTFGAAGGWGRRY